MPANEPMNIDYLLDLQHRQWKKMIAATVILVSAALPFFLSEKRLILFLVLVIGIGGVLAMLKWPPSGVVVIILAGLCVPFSVGTGTQTNLNMAILSLVLLLGLWIFHMVSHDRSIRLVPSRSLIPLLGFAIISILSFLVGQLPWFVFAHQKASLVAQIGGLALILLSLGAYLLVGNQVREVRWLELITWAFIIIGGVYVLLNFLPGGNTIKFFQRGSDGSLFWAWFMTITFSQAAFNRRLHFTWRAALGILLALSLWNEIVRNSAWTSGWMPGIIGIVVILFVSGTRYTWLALPIGFAGVALKYQSFYRLLFGGDNQYSLMTRLEAWRVLAKIIEVNPLLGLGPANYYWYTPLFSLLGYHVQFNSHNNYVDLLAETGILGFAFFVWFLFEVGRMGWNLRVQVSEGFPRAYVYGALGGLAAMVVAGMLGDWVIPFTYNLGFTGFRASVIGWIFLGGLLALKGMAITRYEVGGGSQGSQDIEVIS